MREEGLSDRPPRSVDGVLAQGGIRYSHVWEDHLLAERGLDIGRADDVLSITSAGCNVLNLLLQEPRSVTALDLNPAQTALLRLKVAGIRHLSHPRFTSLLGIGRDHDPVEVYEEIKGRLPEDARRFWDDHLEELKSGVVHCGRLEKYLQAFRPLHLDKLHSPDTIRRLLDHDDPAAQARFFDETFCTPEFRRDFTQYFSREMMARHGRDPFQFRFVEPIDVGEYFLGRFRFACTALPLRSNF